MGIGSETFNKLMNLSDKKKNEVLSALYGTFDAYRKINVQVDPTKFFEVIEKFTKEEE